jgi:hypothetical protein
MVCFVFGAVLMAWDALLFGLFSWYGMFCFWSCSHFMVCFVFGVVVQKQNITYHENSSKNKTYHTMRTAPKTKHTIP